MFICYKDNQKITVLFIQAGKTAFSHATDSYSKVSDDVKDVLRYLVIEKGLDINSVYYEVPLLQYLAFSFRNSVFRREEHRC